MEAVPKLPDDGVMACAEVLKRDVFWVVAFPKRPELISILLPKMTLVSTEDNDAPKREDCVEVVDVEKVPLELCVVTVANKED